MEENNRRYEINRRLIGKTVFIVDEGGYYAQVIDVNENDEAKVKYNDCVKVVSLWDVRQLDYSV